MGSRSNAVPIAVSSGIYGVTSGPVTLLMPTGLIATVDAKSVTTMNDVKDSAWKDSKKLPFFATLKVAGKGIWTNVRNEKLMEVVVK